MELKEEEKEEEKGERGDRGKMDKRRGKDERGERKGEGKEVSSTPLTVRVLAVPAKSGHCLLKDLLSVGLKAGVVVSVREKTTNGRQIASLGRGGKREGGVEEVRKGRGKKIRGVKLVPLKKIRKT